MNVKEQFSLRLRKKLKEKELTQADFAKQLNVSTETVSNWCNNTIPRPEKLRVICRYLNCSIDELMSENSNVQSQTKIPEVPISHTAHKKSDTYVESIIEGLTEGEIEEVKDYVRYLKIKRTIH